MAGTGEKGPGRGPGAGQHFLLSAAARRLSLAMVARLSDDDAQAIFRNIRWCDTRGEPVCPRCGCAAVYEHRSRRIFSCKACEKQFSVTSGTIFHARKLALRDILLAIAIFANSAKGHSALHLSRDLNVQYKTAFVLAHKIREALGTEMDGLTASGEVHVDGAYFGGYVKPANWKENRRDRRLLKNQNGKRRVVIVMREVDGRTLPFVVRHEAHAVPILEQRIKPGSTVHADEARSWDPLHYGGLDVRRINHQEAYSDGDACTNQAESFFSRIRRAEIGMHHHIAGPYLHAYAHEMAWREDARRIDNGTQVLIMGLSALTHPPSWTWKGYWQRARRKPSPSEGHHP
ncbi:IS1595 family transposase [Antarcticirhabdus aurantiaca]|uniref:IS1595 family transposase n=1 Tax=Antarcticirhabdus aurantiaca TaxID=2606717 RepID=A0ACD4NZW4_9HYPH|nr:IS1595 family transposase [Antarcticirhabdus aurantiaca]WAJ31609.1 IS1595 family transposase [Jeongeuplla avenae]